MFSSIQEYLKKRDTRFREFYKNFTVQDGSSREEIEKYSTFLVNDTKKKVLLRNSLIQDLQSILQSSNSACDTVCTKKRAEHMNDIQNILRTAESLDTSTAEDFREIIKRYVFLGLTHTDTRPTSYFVEGRSPIGDLASTILPAGSDLMSRYRILSEIFNEYLIAQGDEKKLDENMQNFIRVLVTGKTIENTELLPLIFYIKEYLTLRNEDINISSLGMASSMITLADRHLDAQKDTSKKFDSLSIFLYTFVSLFDQSHENIVTRFFE